jgi:S1-C subfamily serine protease
LFNPDLDVAVLYVPGLTAAPLPVVDTAKPGDPGVIAGYPGGGALTSDPGRVQSAFTDTLGVGTDIYGNPGTPRRVLLIAGANAPGNSGGPFLTTRGEVAGLMSAQRAKDNPSAFALAPAQYSPITAAAASSRSPVGTGPCPKG